MRPGGCNYCCLKRKADSLGGILKNSQGVLELAQSKVHTWTNVGLGENQLTTYKSKVRSKEVI